MAETQIDLTGGRLVAKTLVRRLVPTNIRLSAAIYDRKNRRYVAIPGYRGLIPIQTRGELLKLWRAIREAVESQGWKTDDGVRAPLAGSSGAGGTDAGVEE